MNRNLIYLFVLLLAGCGLDSPPDKKGADATSAQTAPAANTEAEKPAAEPVPSVESSPLPPLAPSNKLHAGILNGDYDSMTPASGSRKPDIKNANVEQLKLIRCGYEAKSEGLRNFLFDLAEDPTQILQSNDKGQTLFHILADANAVDLVTGLVKCGFSTGATSADKQGRIPLHYAKTKEMAQLLWDYKTGRRNSLAAYATPDYFGQIPLLVYAQNKRVELVNFYVENFCRARLNLFKVIGESFWDNILNSQDAGGMTALHIAAINDDPQVADALASCRSVNLQVKDRSDRQPLHYAAEHPDFAAGYAIMRSAQGRAMNITSDKETDKDIRNETPLDIAKRIGSAQTVYFMNVKSGLY